MLTEDLPRINEHIPINRNKVKGNNNGSFFKKVSSMDSKNLYDDSTLSNFKITTNKLRNNTIF